MMRFASKVGKAASRAAGAAQASRLCLVPPSAWALPSSPVAASSLLLPWAGSRAWCSPTMILSRAMTSSAFCSQRQRPAAAAKAMLAGAARRGMGHARKLKTKKGAAKRFIVTGKGRLKRGHAGKGHLTSGKSKTRLRRLNSKVLLEGTWHKKMKSLLITGK